MDNSGGLSFFRHDIVGDMLEIISIENGSIGSQLELEVGDKLVAINNHKINDLIDYQLYAQGEELVLDIQKKNGELWELELERDEDDPLGFGFEHPERLRLEVRLNRLDMFQSKHHQH